MQLSHPCCRGRRARPRTRRPAPWAARGGSAPAVRGEKNETGKAGVVIRRAARDPALHSLHARPAHLGDEVRVRLGVLPQGAGGLAHVEEGDVVPERERVCGSVSGYVARCLTPARLTATRPNAPDADRQQPRPERERAAEGLVVLPHHASRTPARLPRVPDPAVLWWVGVRAATREEDQQRQTSRRVLCT